VRRALRDDRDDAQDVAKVLADARKALVPHLTLDADGATNVAAAAWGTAPGANAALGAAFSTRGASNDAGALVAGARVLYASAATALGGAPEAATVLKVYEDGDVDVEVVASGRVVNTVAARIVGR